MPYTDQGLPFQAGSASSYDGAQVAAPKAGTQKAIVLQAIQEHGPVTDHQIETLTKLPLNIVNARRNALWKDGLIGPADMVKGPFRAKNQRWKVTND